MDLSERRNMDPRERLIADREQAAQLLAGQMVPAKLCRACGGVALVKEGALDGDEGRGFTGILVTEVAICLGGCGHVAARGKSPYRWRYGRSSVELVNGVPYNMGQLLQPITTRQRDRIQLFLDSTELLV